MEQLQKLKEIVEYHWNSGEKKQTLKRKLQELRGLEADISIELKDAESLSHKKRKNEVENWLRDVERVNNKVQRLEKEMGECRLSLLWGKKVEKMTGEVVELIEKSRFQGGLVLDVPEIREDALLTTELVGLAFQANVDKISTYIMKDEFSSIGIYGLGGVGKTALATYVHNQLLERPNTFRHVWWITVSQDIGIYKLQNLIAKTIHLDLSEEEDEKKRAARLSKALIIKQKYVLILDDIWSPFPLEKVGLPVAVNGCKLILTTRSLEVCRKMGCQEKLKVEPLPEEEAWTLFKEKLGNSVVLPLEIILIAKSIAKQCAGLPLAIITMAASMREVDDVCEWRNALEELRESKISRGDMEELFHILKFSYSHLSDSALQHCFLYCALFPEDFNISREDLIGYLIVEGIIDGMESGQATFDKGNAMLNKLENVCLLEGFTVGRNYRYVKMHDLIRDMALQIMEISPKALIKAGKQLKELPDEANWREDLIRASFIGNCIKEVPYGLSPRCPNLSTLLLCKNDKLESIADSFFSQLQALKVLDLSHTSIQKLPSSVSNLVGLTALLLKNCSMLSHIPSLAKLTMLKKLDLSYTGLEEAPPGMELLSNLKYLNLCGTRLEFTAGMLPKLSRLQCLKVGKVRGEEVACLMKLETLECNFYDLFEFHIFMHSVEERDKLMDWNTERLQLSKYNLKIGQIRNLMDEAVMDFFHFKRFNVESSKEVRLYNCSIKRGDSVLLPKDIQELTIADCCDVRSLQDICPPENAPRLKSLLIRKCDAIEFLLSSLNISPDMLKSLEILELYSLKNLHALFSSDVVTPPHLPSNSTFSLLKTLIVRYCSSMKKLFPHWLLQNLKNLEVIEVRSCDEMEEIITEEEHERIISGEERCHSIVNKTEFGLPKLRLLRFIELPELKNICNGVLVCDSLQEICAVDCLKLKNMPFSFPLPSLKRITIHPEEWWESVELNQPDAKKFLQPLYNFRDMY